MDADESRMFLAESSYNRKNTLAKVALVRSIGGDGKRSMAGVWVPGDAAPKNRLGDADPTEVSAEELGFIGGFGYSYVSAAQVAFQRVEFRASGGKFDPAIPRPDAAATACESCYGS